MKLSDLNRFKKKWVYVEWTDPTKEDGFNEVWGILTDVELGFMTIQKYGGDYDYQLDIVIKPLDEVVGLVRIPIEKVFEIKVAKLSDSYPSIGE